MFYDVLIDVFEEIDWRDGVVLKTCSRVCSLWKLAAEDCRAEFVRFVDPHLDDGFVEACYEPLPCLKWFVERWPSVSEVSWRRGMVDVCRYGRTRNAQWLKGALRLSREDIRFWHNAPLRESCENGHLELAQWLKRTFALTREDALAQDCIILDDVCYYGHLDVAMWLEEAFDLRADDVLERQGLAFHQAVEGGHVEMLDWLVDEFGLDGSDAVNNDHCAVCTARRLGHEHVLAWLARKLKITGCRTIPRNWLTLLH